MMIEQDGKLLAIDRSARLYRIDRWIRIRARWLGERPEYDTTWRHLKWLREELARLEGER